MGQESKLSLTQETRSGVVAHVLAVVPGGNFRFPSSEAPMVAATSAWFCGFSRVQSNYLRLVREPSQASR